MKLYYFPLSTYAQKTLMAFHEKGVAFEPRLVDLRDPEQRDEYRKIYPLGKIPLLICDDDRVIPESSIIIEYLDGHFDSGMRLIPADKDLARQTRFLDRMHDNYLNESVTTLLFQSWRPPAERDQERIETARFRLGVIYDYMDGLLAGRDWVMGEELTMADCAAAPPLLYAQEVFPFAERENLSAYWKRLRERESYGRVLEEVAPHLEELKAARSA